MSIPPSTRIWRPRCGVRIEHVVEVNLDLQRVFSDQAEMREPARAIIGGDDSARDWSYGAAFAVSRDSGVRIDPDQRVAFFELHGLDRSDPGQAGRGCGERFKARAKLAGGSARADFRKLRRVNFIDVLD